MINENEDGNTKAEEVMSLMDTFSADWIRQDFSKELILQSKEGALRQPRVSVDLDWNISTKSTL